AGGAGGDVAHEETLVAASRDPLAGPPTHRAGAWFGARLRTGSAARPASSQSAHRDRLLPAAQHAGKWYGEPNLDVGAARSRGPRRASEEALEKAAGVEAAQTDVGKDISKVHPRPQIFGAEPGDRRTTAGVVLGAFLRVGQHRVGLGRLLEALLCVRFLAAVGVVLQCEAMERLLDLLAIRVAR